jgi:hypothetical protein
MLTPVRRRGINVVIKWRANPREYDGFKHLCRSLFSSKGDLFAMITAYFDDSATEDVAAVAGYIGSVTQWERFNAEWQKMLDEYHIKVMRRSDLECFQGEFVGWTPPKRTEFIKKAQKIIKNRTYVPVGSAIIKADFDEVIPASIRKFVGGYYGMCATLSLVLANRWSENARHREPIDWIFEAGTVGSGQFNQVLNALYSNSYARDHFRINGWAFRGKDILPLQAADLMAYETSKNVQNQIVHEGEEISTAQIGDRFAS